MSLKGSKTTSDYLEYDECNEKYFNYEPFLIGNRSFGLTIDVKNMKVSYHPDDLRYGKIIII